MQRGAFMDGAFARGISRDKASDIFDTIDKFAGYGFPKGPTQRPMRWSLTKTAYVKATIPSSSWPRP